MKWYNIVTDIYYRKYANRTPQKTPVLLMVWTRINSLLRSSVAQLVERLMLGINLLNVPNVVDGTISPVPK